ncbi:MAG: DUF1501 domain-containing protein [Burkholderiales bacterium]|nr:DUF1501 domain-containing protein [Burkholderiales bacterium]
MNLTRRHFLQAAGSAGVLLPLTGISQLAWGAENTDRDLLVIVFQRGGCDGLSLVSPVNDQGYIDARAPEMRVAASGDKAGLALDSPMDAHIDFRLHPEARALQDLYKGKQLAFIHAVGLPNGTRSHFEAQDLIERGVADNQALKANTSGWLARSLSQMGADSMVPAVAAVPGLSHMLQGAPHALALPDLQAGVGLPGGPQGLAALQALYANRTDMVGAAGRGTLDALSAIDHQLPRGADNKVQNYQPAHNAVYDNNDLGRGLQAIARLSRMSVGLRVACVDQGGWDTHDNQPGRLNGQFGALARNLAAFHDDMAGSGTRVTTVVMTEFGRRLRSNRSNGTDHGHGGLMMVMGETVQGGQIYGRWPGLATEQLDRGVDLAVTTDYRAVLSEVLVQQGLGKQAIGSQVFPGYQPDLKLGLFRT